MKLRRLSLFILFMIVVGAWLALRVSFRLFSNAESNSLPYIARWFNEPSARAELSNLREATCDGAVFMLPSSGLIGLLWDDPASPYTVMNPHTGLDIFGAGDPGEVPVYAAYEGYLTRLPEWISTVILRHDDPLVPGRTIWTYYTHMASRDGVESYIVDDFPAGTSEVWVEQGTLLGYQGLYAGTGGAIGLHVHFSVVLSDNDQRFLNESQLENTIDPSPYFKMPLSTLELPVRPIACTPP